MKSIGYWVVMCYALVFFTLLEYCVVLSIRRTFSNNRETRNIMNFEDENDEDKRIRIALKIEKISRILVPIYLFSFTSLYFFIMNRM